MSAAGATITKPAPKVEDFEAFLLWLEAVSGEADGAKISFDLGALSDELFTPALEVIGAIGHFVAPNAPGVREKRPVLETVVVGETVFADFEKRPEKLEEFTGYIKRCLASVSGQNYTAKCLYVHFVYISVDKLDAVLDLAKWINRLNAESVFAQIQLVLFRHPEGGYAAPVNGQIDALIRPSIQGERPNELFERGWRNLALPWLEELERFIRITIDDDDVWMPWTINEVVTNAVAAQLEGGRDIKFVGIPNQFLYYPLEHGRVDMVSMKMIMNGSKFVTSSNWSSIKENHPWMIPESFSQNMARQFRRLGITLMVSYKAKPCFVYVRRHGRLSALTKFEHYRDVARTATCIGSEDYILEAGQDLVDEWFTRMPAQFGIDPPTLVARGKMETDTGLLRVAINADELVEGHHLNPEDLKVVVTCRTAEGEQVTEHDFASSLNIDPEGWEGRSGLAIWDRRTDKRIFSAWIRGEAKFLS